MRDADLTNIQLIYLFASIALTAAAILQGAGHTVFPAVSVLAGGALKWVLNVWLVPGWVLQERHWRPSWHLPQLRA